MKSKSRLPKFPPMPVSGPVVQTDPRVWIVKRNGLPCWFKPFAPGVALHPQCTPRALEEAGRQGVVITGQLNPGLWEVVELKSRENPWHPSGRLERLTLRRNGILLVLKFYGEGEPVQCISVIKEAVYKAPTPPSKYKGPRLQNDTKSAVVSEKPRKFP